MALVPYEPWYVGLLGVAETFRVSNPPKIRQCIQCLQAVFQFQAPPAIQAKTHLQIGKLLRTYTKNVDEARSHLEKATVISQSLGSGYEELHLEAASILAEIHQEQGQYPLAKTTLRQALEVTNGNNMQFWQFRLTFKLAEVHAFDRELNTAAEVLGMGQRLAEQCGSYYMNGLFSLTQAMVFMIMKDSKSANAVLTSNGAFLERWQASDSHKESLQCFYLLLNVWNLLVAGRAKCVRPYLKQLQQSIQVLTAMPSDDSQFYEAERFRWLSKDSLCVLVYLVTVVHSMYGGYMEKALKYSEKALALLERMKGGTDHGLLPIFQFTLMEHIILCRIVQGQLPAAIKEISQTCQVLQHDGRLLATKKPVLHTLLGLYAMAMNLMKQATAQFTVAFETCSSQELKNFIGLNLAIIYIRAGGTKQRELAALLPQIRPDNLSVSSHNLQAAYYYVCGLQAFFESRLQEAKKYLRETLKIANAEDLNRLTACSLVLLGHTFLAFGNPQEALNMVLPATQLAGKIPDSYIQLWAASLLRDLYGMLGNPALAAENYHLHHTCTKHLLESHLKATKLSEHRLIEWTGDSSPPRQMFPQPGLPTLCHQPGTSGMIK